MVFVRYVLNQNTIWQTDFVTYSLVAATFIGSPYVLMTRGHVNVDVLPHYLGPRPRYWLALVSTLMALAFCVGHAGAHLPILARSLEQALGLEHHVAGAPVDSLCVDADRPGYPDAAVRRSNFTASSPAASRLSASARSAGHEPGDAGHDRSRRHADRAAVGRAGRLRSGRALDRLHRDLPGLRRAARGGGNLLRAV